MRKVIKSFLIFVPFVISCSYDPHARPSSVPVSATWAGGADGGAWIDCKYIHGLMYRCAVFDNQGELWSEGNYALDRPRAKVISPADYNFFDGNVIGLKDGAMLVLKKE